MSHDQSHSRVLSWIAVAQLFGLLVFAAFTELGGAWMAPAFAVRSVLAAVAIGAATWLLAGRKLPMIAPSVFVFFALGLQSTHALLEGPSRMTGLVGAAVLFVGAAQVLRAQRADWPTLFLPLCTLLLLVPAALKDQLFLALVLTVLAVLVGQGVIAFHDLLARVPKLERTLLNLNSQLSTKLNPKWIRFTQVSDTAFTSAVASSTTARHHLSEGSRQDREGNGMTRIVQKDVSGIPMNHDLQWIRDLQAPLAALQMLTHADDELSRESKRLMDEAILRIRHVTQQAEAESVRARAEKLAEPRSPMIAPALAPESAEAAEGGGNLSRGLSQTYHLVDIMRMIDGVIAAKSAALLRSSPHSSSSSSGCSSGSLPGSSPGSSSGVTLTWGRTAGRDLPVAVEINAEDFTTVIESALDHAIESLGSGQGVVRIGIHPSLRQLQVTIEDNGRGISEELLMRVQARGLSCGMSAANGLTFKQMRALIMFWGGRVERQARLGVGSRVTIEIPRVDAFASPFAVARPRVVETAALLS
ncbi:MAG: ATP-binding protein [Bdellovibrionaceae bacterium]|nr:ATP-binding protein [Pseudobdellovibrionaceae bacterium]